MQIDAATRRNLELTQALRRAGGVAIIGDRPHRDRSRRPALGSAHISPSLELETIYSRLDAVSFAVEQAKCGGSSQCAEKRHPILIGHCRGLRLIGAGRVILLRFVTADRGNGDRKALDLQKLPETLRRPQIASEGHEELAGLLDRALIAEPPLLQRDGGFIASGYDAELDDARLLRDEGRGVIAALQAEYAAETGVSALKDQTQQRLGLLHRNPGDPRQQDAVAALSATFIHRQTTATPCASQRCRSQRWKPRFSTPGIAALELEKRLYYRLKTGNLDQSGPFLSGQRARRD